MKELFLAVFVSCLAISCGESDFVATENGQAGSAGKPEESCVTGMIDLCDCADGNVSTKTCGVDHRFGPCSCEPETACVPNQIELCDCASGPKTGTKTCGSNNKFGNCECPQGAGGSSGSASDSGASGSAGQGGSVVEQDAGVDAVQPESEAGVDAQAEVGQDAPPVYTVCQPGTTQSCYCVGFGLTGNRYCDQYGSGFGDCVCAQGQPLGFDITYVVLTRQMFVPQLSTFVAWKQAQGHKVAMYDAEQATAGEQGADIPAKLQQFLRRVKHDIPSVEYLLIVGAPDPAKKDTDATAFTQPWEVPIKYVAKVSNDEAIEPIIATDQYYASVTVDWPAQMNTEWAGAFGYKYDLAVGRVPAKSATQIADWTAKTMAWIPPVAPVESRFITARCGANSALYGNEEFATEYTRKVNYHYCINDQGGDIASLANQDGSDYVSSLSHAWVGGISKWPATNGYTLDSVSPQFTKPPAMYVHGCMIGGLDYSEESLGAKLSLARFGTVVFVGYSRSHHDIEFPFWDAVFFSGQTRAGHAMYGLKAERGKDAMSSSELENMFMINLFGDPSLELAKPATKIQPLTASIVDTVANPILPFTTQSLDNAVHTGNVVFPLWWSNLPYKQATITPALSADAIQSTRWYGGDPAMYPQDMRVGFSDCDTTQRSCVATKVKLTNKLDMVCGHLRLDQNGNKKFDLKFMTGYQGQIKLRLMGQPGSYFPEGQIWDGIGTELWSQDLDSPVAGTSMSPISSASLPPNDPIPQGDWTGQYLFPFFYVEAREGLELVGKCIFPYADPNVFSAEALQPMNLVIKNKQNKIRVPNAPFRFMP